MILKVRSPQELEKLRKRFKIVFTKTRYAVYDYEKDTLRAYSLDDGIRLHLSKDESFDISKFALDAWRTRFHTVADVFTVQNAITMARLNGASGTNLDEIERYL